MSVHDAVLEHRRRLVAVIAASPNRRLACAQAGIHPSTFYRWCKQPAPVTPRPLGFARRQAGEPGGGHGPGPPRGRSPSGGVPVGRRPGGGGGPDAGCGASWAGTGSTPVLSATACSPPTAPQPPRWCWCPPPVPPPPGGFGRPDPGSWCRWTPSTSAPSKRPGSARPRRPTARSGSTPPSTSPPPTCGRSCTPPPTTPRRRSPPPSPTGRRRPHRQRVAPGNGEHRQRQRIPRRRVPRDPGRTGCHPPLHPRSDLIGAWLEAPSQTCRPPDRLAPPSDRT